VDVEERVAEWIPCGGGFIAADVIRWTEKVWRDVPRGPQKTFHMRDTRWIIQKAPSPPTT